MFVVLLVHDVFLVSFFFLPSPYWLLIWFPLAICILVLGILALVSGRMPESALWFAASVVGLMAVGLLSFFVLATYYAFITTIICWGVGLTVPTIWACHQVLGRSTSVVVHRPLS
jgi:hypothetical protein